MWKENISNLNCYYLNILFFVIKVSFDTSSNIIDI